jgi:biopolymer transport protein ExbD
MAEMDVSSSGGKKGPGVKKSKKLSTRVDLTPMVDLGFLLITFFMYTTSMSTLKAIPISTPAKMPDDPNIKPPETKETMLMNIFLAKDDKVVYFTEDKKTDIKVTDINGIRQEILALRDKAIANGDTNFLTFTIKPMPDAKFKSFIAGIDEMRINMFKPPQPLNYFKVEPKPEEIAMVNNKINGMPPSPAPVTNKTN